MLAQRAGAQAEAFARAATLTHASAEEVLGYFEILSNWGRWGEDDAFRTLNFVTLEVTVAAATEIKLSRSVPALGQ